MKIFFLYALIASLYLCILESKPNDESSLRDSTCNKITPAVNRFSEKDERDAAFARRTASMCLRVGRGKKYSIEKEENGDEKDVPHFAAKFSKSLAHDEQGILTKEGETSYKSLLQALTTSTQNLYNDIKLADGSVYKLANPQGSATFSCLGLDSSQTKLSRFAKISTDKAAAQLLEVYLLALARDVEFKNYGTGLATDRDTDGLSITNKAARVLTHLDRAFEGPRNNQNIVDTQVLFRGNNPGSLVGPFISQFLYQPMNIPVAGFPAKLGLSNLPKQVFYIQQLRPIAGPQNFGITLKDFAALQNGDIPKPYSSSDYDPLKKRYIITGRDLASFAHFDYPYEPYYNALQILFAFKFPLATTSPYVNGTITKEGSFLSCGIVDSSSLMAMACLEAGKACWAHKWRGQRVLRPEAYAGLVHLQKTSGINEFGLPETLFEDHDGINVLEWIERLNNSQGTSTFLMPLAYPEGAPSHPSYPSGHAAFAGACITIIKAFFKDTVLFSSVLTPVKPDPNDPTRLIPLSDEGEKQMTLASELNKLASNIAIGRNFAGIHYRADADQGLLLGEAVALKVLQDHALCMTEETFTGFELTKIDGTRVHITAECIKKIS